MSDSPNYYFVYGRGASSNTPLPDSFDPNYFTITPSAPSTSRDSRGSSSTRGPPPSSSTIQYPHGVTIVDASPSFAPSSPSYASSQYSEPLSHHSQPSSRYSQAPSQHSRGPSHQPSERTATPSRLSSAQPSGPSHSLSREYLQKTYSQASRTGNRIENWQDDIPVALHHPRAPPSIRSTTSSHHSSSSRPPDARSVTSLRSGSVRTNAHPDYYDGRPEDARTTIGVEDVERCQYCKRTKYEFRKHGHEKRCPFKTSGY